MEQIQAEYPQKDLSPEPEPDQQLRQRLLKKGERESICHHILKAREMDKITGKLRQE